MKTEFKNALEVAKYLEDEGWKVSKTALYTHRNKGMLKPNADGTYALKSVLKYARAHLQQKSMVQKTGDEQLQTKKALAEIVKITEMAKTVRFKREILEGKYVLREEVELEMAARAAALYDGLKGMVQANSKAWIATVKGRQKNTADLIRAVIGSVEDLFNDYAKPQEFEVEVGEEI